MLVKLLISLTIYALLHSTAQITLKIGLNQVGSFSADNLQHFLATFSKVIKNPNILIGTALFASAYFFWLIILSWFKVSIAYPLLSLSFIFVVIFSYFFLNEKLFLHNYLGIFLIIMGIILLLYKQG